MSEGSASGEEVTPSQDPLARNAFFLILAQGLVLGISLIQVGLLSRGLGVAGFGEWCFLWAGVSLVQALADGGTSTTLVREWVAGRVPFASLVQAALGLRLGLASLGTLAWLGVVFALQDSLPVSPLPAFILGLTPLLSAVAGVGRGILRAKEKMGEVLVLSAGEAGARLLLTAGVIHEGGGIAEVAGASLLASLGGTLLSVWRGRCWIYMGKSPSALRFLSTTSTPFALSSLLGMINARMDVYFSAALLGAGPTGLLGAGGRGIDVGKSVGAAVYDAILPRLGRRVESLSGEESEKEEARGMVTVERGMMAAFGVAVAVALVFSVPLLALAFGAGFEKAAPAFRWQAWSLLPSVLGTLTCARLVVRGGGRWIAGCDAGCGALGILLHLLLIPRFGLEGAALASLGRELSLAVAYRVGLLWVKYS